MDKKFNIAMISGPQNDMRHTGHVGYDGTTFGDVAFIVDNYDKLPKKTQPTTGELCFGSLRIVESFVFFSLMRVVQIMFFICHFSLKLFL